jgi:hypothetical protein
MTAGTKRTDYAYRYNEKDYLVKERFYPGEFGAVILLGIASLLLWAVAVYGITNEPKAKYTADNANNATNAY